MAGFCTHCCFWIQMSSAIFFCVAAALVSNDNLDLRSLAYETKRHSMITFCITALVFSF